MFKKNEKTQFYDESLAASVQEAFSELFRGGAKDEGAAEKGDQDEDCEAASFAEAEA